MDPRRSKRQESSRQGDDRRHLQRRVGAKAERVCRSHSHLRQLDRFSARRDGGSADRAAHLAQRRGRVPDQPRAGPPQRRPRPVSGNGGRLVQLLHHRAGTRRADSAGQRLGPAAGLRGSGRHQSLQESQARRRAEARARRPERGAPHRYRRRGRSPAQHHPQPGRQGSQVSPGLRAAARAVARLGRRSISRAIGPTGRGGSAARRSKYDGCGRGQPDRRNPIGARPRRE